MKCLITGDKTNFTYKGKPVKEEIFKIAQAARLEFMHSTGKKISIAESLDEIANHIKFEFQKKVKVYKENLQEEVDKLEEDAKREQEVSDKPKLSIVEDESNNKTIEPNTGEV